MRTYNAYRPYRQIFLGWRTRFIVDGEQWVWNLRPICKYREDVEGAILKRFPAATNIEVVKILSIDYDMLTVDQFKAAIAELKREAESIPLPEGEEFFDALDDFAGPPSEGFEYTPEQDAHYVAWLAKRQAKAKAKVKARGETLEERKAKAKAKVMAFYTPEAIANELSPFDD
jgi:hypothetical protein